MFTGITASQLTADAAQQSVLITALAAFDTHIQAGDISISSITPEASTGTIGLTRRRLQSDQTSVTFVITSYLSTFGYTSATDTAFNTVYTSLSAAMVDFVQSGDYATEITVVAASQSVTMTAVPVDDSVAVGDLQTYDDSHKHNNDDDKIGDVSEGGFAAIMVIVVLAVLGALGWVYYSRSKVDGNFEEGAGLTKPINVDL